MSAIECRYRVAPELLAAAIRSEVRPGWWQQVVPVVGAAVVVLCTFVLSRAGWEGAPEALIGFALGCAATMALWQLAWRRQLRRVMDAHEAVAQRAGDIVSRFGPEGIETRSVLGQSFNTWAAVTGLDEIPGGTALRLGAVNMPIPDTALPEGMTGAVFRAALSGWRVSA